MDGSPNLFRLRTDRIAQALAALPAVESARVEVRLPDTVVVTVVERQPKLIWVIGDRRYVVDDTGLLFGQVDSVGNPIYPPPGSLHPSSAGTQRVRPARPVRARRRRPSSGPAVDRSLPMKARVPARRCAGHGPAHRRRWRRRAEADAQPRQPRAAEARRGAQPDGDPGAGPIAPAGSDRRSGRDGRARRS